VSVFLKLVLHSIKLSAPSLVDSFVQRVGRALESHFSNAAVRDNYQRRLITAHFSILSTLPTGTETL
jgi:hypothetical protein